MSNEKINPMLGSKLGMFVMPAQHNDQQFFQVFQRTVYSGSLKVETDVIMISWSNDVIRM